MKNKQVPFARQVHWEYIFIALFMLAAFAFICIRGDRIYVTLFDNLDSNIPWLKMMKDNDLFFTLDGTVPFLGGVTRNYLQSNLKCYTWLYILLPTFYALVTGWFLKILLAMVGFAAVGKRMYADDPSKMPTIIFCGFLYGLLPTFPTAAFSFASLPLLLWLLISIYHSKDRRYLWGTLFYPMLSNVSTFGLFVCGFLLVFFLVDWLVNKKPAWRLFAAIFILGIGYAITEWRLFYMMFFSGVTSIRATFVSSYISFEEMVKSILEVFVNSYKHSDSLHARLVLPVCGLYFLFVNFNYIRKRAFKRIFTDYYNWLMVWIGFNCVIYAADSTAWFDTIISTVLPPLQSFGFARTLWLNPFLWYFSFMVVMCRIPWRSCRSLLVLLAFCVLCVTPSTYNVLYENLRIAKYELTDVDYPHFTYAEQYSEDLFETIKADIDYNGEWSVAFGMHPAILQYNGIATLDGYLSSYPADYKAQFRELIAPGLESDLEHAQYYDTWGGRAYIFSNEIDYWEAWTMPQEEAVLPIDPQVFAEMDGKYVFSRVRVSNMEDLGLELRGVYTDKGSPYTMHVYALTQE